MCRPRIQWIVMLAVDRDLSEELKTLVRELHEAVVDL
jgi:hypothetical protein